MWIHLKINNLMLGGLKNKIKADNAMMDSTTQASFKCLQFYLIWHRNE